MRRFIALVLAVLLFAFLIGCEQEIDPALLAALSDSIQPSSEYPESEAADAVLITDKDSAQFGTLLDYYGLVSAENGDFYACETGYIPAENGLRVLIPASGTDLIPADELWILPYDNVKLRSAPAQDSETLKLVSEREILPVSAVSFTDALYCAVSTSDCYGYISSLSAYVSKDPAELEFYSILDSFAPAGAQITLIDDGEIISSYAYGLANIASGTDMTTETKMRVASLSKVLLCISAMKMRDEGVIDIDKNIGEYWSGSISNPSYPDRDITLRSIFTHTSSIKPKLSYLGFDELKDYLYTAKAYDSAKKPNTANAWEYNNFATGLGGATLELALGTPLQDYMTRTLFTPMGIEAAYSIHDLPEGSEYAVLYKEDGTLARPDEALISVSDMAGRNSAHFAGGLYISSEDYAKLLLLLINNGIYDGMRIISQESVDEIEKVHYDLNDSLGFSQCLVLRKRALYGRNLFYHTGNAYGTIAMASYDAESGDGIVFVATGADSDTSSDGIYELCSAVCEKMYTEILI